MNRSIDISINDRNEINIQKISLKECTSNFKIEKFLKLVSAFFLFFHQRIAHLKSSFCSLDIQISVFLSSPLMSLSAIALEDINNCLSKNLITHFA